MGTANNMAAKRAEQAPVFKAELATAVGEIKGEGAAPATAVEEPKKTPNKAAAPKPKAAPVAVADSIAYEAKRGRKAKYQSDDPRHPTTIVFTESQYQRLRRYAFDHNMGISDVLIEAFAQMTGED